MAITEAETQDLLGRARLALQQGDKEKARDLLIKLLEQDDRSAKGWLLLSGAVDAVEEQRICLENVLTLEPTNTAARQGLEFLNKLYPPEPAPAPVAAAPPAAPAANAPEPSVTYQPAATPAPAPAVPPIDSQFSTASLGDEHEPLHFPTSAPADDDMSSWPQFGASSDALPWDGNGALGSGANSTPVPLFPPDDPWAELRANMSAPSTEVPAPLTIGTPSTPYSSNGAYPAAASEPPNLPSWAADLPGDPAPPADLGFGDTPLASIAPAEPFTFGSSGAANANPLAALPELPAPDAPTAAAGLPDWALSLGPSNGAPAPDAPNPAWTLPAAVAAAPASPFPEPFIAEPTPFGDGGSPFGSSTPLFGSAMPTFDADQQEEQGSNELPADSPWAGTFGGGLGAGAVTAPAEDNVGGQQFGEPGPAPFGLDDDNLRGSSPSIISRPPLSGRAAGAVPGFPCPNCGELAVGNALSCSRCQFRFYANCPKCGEYIDTTDVSPTGDDTCPRCGEHVDKLKLGRNDGGRGQTPREAVVAQIAVTRPATEHAATQALTQARQQSTARTLLGVLVVLALIIFLLFVLPNLMEANGIQLRAPDLNNIFPTPAP